ncbi:MAG TPA: membrane protein insertion efficiency factor YidD [Propionibacteriaceae bacterium]|nr:membrane protein insertion efficiency factor YidD [Propionibacteriaceae bacterium]
MKYVLIGLLKVWRLTISPIYGNVCRYYPSCSAYALRAVEFHGAVKGSWLTVRRLLRCHPWSPGGYDPVPGTPEWQAELAEQQMRSEFVEDRPSTGSAHKSTQNGWNSDDDAERASRQGVNAWNSCRC